MEVKKKIKLEKNLHLHLLITDLSHGRRVKWSRLASFPCLTISSSHSKNGDKRRGQPSHEQINDPLVPYGPQGGSGRN